MSFSSLYPLIYLLLFAGMYLLSVIFKIAGKLRLAVPLAYLLIASASTIFTDWASKYERYILWGLYLLTGLSVLSWIVSFVKVIRGWWRKRRQAKAMEDFVSWQNHKAREMGVPLTGISFDENYNLIDPRTGTPVNFRAGE